MSNIMQDIFKLFAKFPDKLGVEAAFNKGTSELSGYGPFKTTIQNLQEHSLIPEIKHFLFGVNEDIIKKYISNFNSYYLFIDYGDINSEVDGYNRRPTGMYIAATVAIPINSDNHDIADQVLLSDITLDYLLRIRKNLIDNQKQHPWLKDLSDNHDISPFVARELNGSVGWTMTFRKEGFDFV